MEREWDIRGGLTESFTERDNGTDRQTDRQIDRAKLVLLFPFLIYIIYIITYTILMLN